MQFYPPAKWEALRNEYVTGQGTVRSLAQIHGVNKKTAEQRAVKEHWTHLRRERAQAQLAVLIPSVFPSPPAPPPPEITPASEDFMAKKLYRLELQLKRLDDLLDAEQQPGPIERLTAAKARLEELWCRFKNIPQPGSRKPARERANHGSSNWRGPQLLEPQLMPELPSLEPVLPAETAEPASSELKDLGFVADLNPGKPIDGPSGRKVVWTSAVATPTKRT